MNYTPRELTFVLTEERGIPSFDPAHSDTLLNAYFIEQMVGTLTKHGFDGVAQGCLAESWSVSEDRLQFSFKMRSGMICEDGTPISAKGYATNLERLFRLYMNTNKSIPVFERLEGFSEFRSSVREYISGIKVENDQIMFKFDTVPDGILAFLSMPYYGYYCDANFKSDGTWKDSTKIIASGQWKLGLYKTDSVNLIRRKDWFNNPENAPDSVNVRMMTFDEAKSLPPGRTIIQKRIEHSKQIPIGYRKFLSTPTDLKAVVFSPVKNGPFKDPKIRSVFKECLQTSIKNIGVRTENAKDTIAFYPGKKPQEVPKGEVDSTEIKKWSGYRLKAVVSNALTPLQLEYVQQILRAGAERFGMTVYFEGEDRTKPGWKERLDALEDMDIRVVRVSVGGNYEPWVVNMMFCSRMGVSFPDPSQRICELAKNLTERSPETAAKFETIVAEDAAVIPLFHTSFSWLVSADVGIDNLSPTSDLIRFELIELK